MEKSWKIQDIVLEKQAFFFIKNGQNPAQCEIQYIEHAITINNENINIVVWDTAGQEKFKFLNKLFIKN